MERHRVVPARRTLSFSYDSVAWCYDEVAAGYSLGRIRKAKHAHLRALRPGDRVLYAGVGRGDDATLAAGLGARVTAVDVSSKMLGRLAGRLEARGLPASLLETDVLDHRERGYDWVVANFFLNLFALAPMRVVLEHLLERLAPTGRIAIADFAPPSGPVVSRALARAYYGPVDVAAWALGLAALHPIYDYGEELARFGVEVELRKRFGPYEALLSATR